MVFSLTKHADLQGESIHSSTGELLGSTTGTPPLGGRYSEFCRPCRVNAAFHRAFRVFVGVLLRCAQYEQGEFKNSSRRRRRRISARTNTSASLPRRLRLLRRFVSSPCSANLRVHAEFFK